MEVQEELLTWLRGFDPQIGVQASAKGRILLDQATVSRLESGILLGNVLKRLCTMEGAEEAGEQLGVLDPGKTSAAKVQNWSIIFEALEALGIATETETKELILAGDFTVIAEILETLYAKETELRSSPSGLKRFRKPKQAPDGALFIESIDTSRPLSEANTCLEFLLIAFCNHFNIRQKQAAGLLTEGNKYLNVILTKGLKGDVQPVLSLYADIKDNIVALCACIAAELSRGSLVLVASALRPGLQSKSEEVVQTTAQFFRAFTKTLEEQGLSLWEWFAGELGGLQAAASALKGSQQTLMNVTEMLYDVAKEQIGEVMLRNVKEVVGSGEGFLRLVGEMVLVLVAIEGARETLIGTGTISAIIEMCLREGDVDPKRNLTVRLSALNLLSLIWKEFYQEVDKSEDVRNSLLSLMKKGCRDKSKVLSFACITQLFTLLDYFSDARSPVAPVLFKTLQLFLIESFHKAYTRELLQLHFTLTLENIQSLPVSQLAEAVVKQIHLNETLDFNTFDFDFFIAIARHPRFEQEQAVQLIDILGKIYLSQLHLAKAAAIPFLLIIGRFLTSETLQEYIYRFGKLAIQLITQGERGKRVGVKHLPRYLNQPVVLGQPLSLEDLVEETSLLQTKNLVLDLLSKVIKLGNPAINAKLKEILATNAANIKASRGEYPRGLIIVLSLIGNPDEILPLYEPTRLQLAWRSPNRSQMRPLLALEDIKPSSHRPKLDPSSPSKPHQLPKLESVTPTKSSKDKMKLLWEKKLEAEKTGQAVILESASMMPEEDHNVEISEEDWDLVLVLFDKYARLLKSLFKQNAGTGYHRDILQAKTTFNQIADRKETITEGEMLTLLRELGLNQQFLAKGEFAAMFKSYLKKNANKEVNYVDFEGFKDMLVKISVICYAKPGFDMGYLPPVIAVQALINTFRNAAFRAGMDTTLYDEPFLTAGDKDILRELNRNLALDPDAQLPTGYRTRIENDILYEYIVPEELCMPQAYCAALEVLDGVLFSALKVHLLEAQVVVQEICVVVEDFRPLKHSNSFTTMSTANPRLARMSPGLKYATIRLFDFHEKPLVLECAFAIDDLITALETHSPQLLLRRRDGPTPNKFLALQAAQQHLDRLERDKSEQKRRVRRQELGQVLEELTARKQAERQKAGEVRRKLEEVKRQQEEMLEERGRREKEERARLLEQWRARKEEEEYREREGEEKRAEAVAASRRERLAFLKQQRDKVTSLSALKRSEKEARLQEEAQNVQDLAAQREQAQKRGKDLLEQERGKRELEVKLKAEFQHLYAREDIIALISEFTPTLEVLFDHYSKVSAKDPLKAFVVQLSGLNKTVQDFKLVPAILSLPEVIQLFRMLTKDKFTEDSKPIGLSSREFKEMLVRIAAIGQREVARGLGMQSPAEVNIENCGVEMVRALFRWMGLTTDARKTLDLLKKINAEPPMHPREKRRRMAKTPV